MKRGIIQIIREDPNRFSIPNMLTISRLVFLPFVVYFLQVETLKTDIFALVFMILSGATDYFDGYVARKYGQKSDVGRLLDPVVDKLSINIVMLSLAAHKALPYWYVFILIARDLVILVSGLFVISRKKTIMESNTLGKYAVFLFALVIITFTLEVDVIKWIFMWLSVILVPATVIGYALTHKDVVKELFKRGSV